MSKVRIQYIPNTTKTIPIRGVRVVFEVSVGFLDGFNCLKRYQLANVKTAILDNRNTSVDVSPGNVRPANIIPRTRESSITTIVDFFIFSL